MNTKFSFIGAGNMGGAILRAACKCLDPRNIYVTDADAKKAAGMAEELGCKYIRTNTEAAEAADFLMLCVKPQAVASVMEEVAPALEKRVGEGRPAVLVSIAAGIKISKLRQYTGAMQPIIRVMPNTPALIGKGLMIISADSGSGTESDIIKGHDIVAELEEVLKGCGETMRLPEEYMDQATAAASCSPAFVYMFIEALADAGVMKGLSRKDSQRMAAAAVLGAGAMVLESGMGPAELKDMVCSPSGSTICGVAALEEAGFRNAVIKAFLASYERNLEMGK